MAAQILRFSRLDKLSPRTLPLSPPIRVRLWQPLTWIFSIFDLPGCPELWPASRRLMFFPCNRFRRSSLSPRLSPCNYPADHPQRTLTVLLVQAISLPARQSPSPLFTSGRLWESRLRPRRSAPPRSAYLNEFPRLRKGKTGRPEFNWAGPLIFLILFARVSFPSLI